MTEPTEGAAVTATPARDWGNRVHGRCPACGSNGSLIVAVGGHVTCSLDKCPNPTSVADLLEAWRPTADQLRALGGESWRAGGLARLIDGDIVWRFPEGVDGD